METGSNRPSIYADEEAYNNAVSAEGVRNLMRHMVEQAAQDLKNQKKKGKTYRTRRKAENCEGIGDNNLELTAGEWLYSSEENYILSFRYICGLFKMDPEYVRKNVYERAASGKLPRRKML